MIIFFFSHTTSLYLSFFLHLLSFTSYFTFFFFFCFSLFLSFSSMEKILNSIRCQWKYIYMYIRVTHKCMERLLQFELWRMPTRIELHSVLPSAIIDIFQQYSEIFKFTRRTLTINFLAHCKYQAKKCHFFSYMIWCCCFTDFLPLLTCTFACPLWVAMRFIHGKLLLWISVQFQFVFLCNFEMWRFCVYRCERFNDI